MAGGWWRLRKGAHFGLGNEDADSVTKLDLLTCIHRPCSTSISVVTRMRFVVTSMLQPRQLRADIPSTTCEGG